MPKFSIPPKFDEIREKAREALLPVKPAGDNTNAERDFLFTAKRTAAGEKLPRIIWCTSCLLNFWNSET